METISIITPVFNEQENIQSFFCAVSDALKEYSVNWDVIYCVDPGTDKTVEIINSLARSDSRVKMLLFSRRIGQDAAITAGLEVTRSDAVVIMDCDLQDPPSILPQMIEEWRSGTKMVIGRRKSRDADSSAKKFFSKTFYRFLQRFSDVPFPSDMGDFRLVDQSIIREFCKYQEQRPFVRGIFSHIAPKYEFVEFDRPERLRGETKYHPQLGGYQVAMNGIIGYSDVLLRISLFFGFFVSAFSFIFGLSYTIASFFVPELPMGVPTVVVLMSLLNGFVLTSVGVLGLYIGRIFEETKGRPRYFVSQSLGVEID